MHRQLAHLYIVNTHYNDIHYYYNDIHYYYNDIHYFNNPNISLIRPPSGPKLFGLVRVYCTKYVVFIVVLRENFEFTTNTVVNGISRCYQLRSQSADLCSIAMGITETDGLV